MKIKSMILLMVINTFIFNICFAQDDISAKLTPSAIDARIAEIRMGDIIINTKPGAYVKVQQVRHEFLFGTAITNRLAENDQNAMSPEDRKIYLKILSENFNYAVHESALKWHDCEKEPDVVDYSIADRIWEICNGLNIPMRGHCIFWEKEEFVMPWLKQLNNDQLRAAVNHRALSVTQHFRGRINEFDLNNEMIHGDFFRRRLGYGIINEMAYMAKLGNPEATLYVNDYGILDVGYNADAYITQIKNLLASGVPISGIGCQGHLSVPFPVIIPAEQVQKTLDKLARFNLPIKITECNFIFDDEKTRTEQLQKLLPIYFAHPSVEAILMWGFWEDAHWQPRSAMWKKDWTPTAQALAYRNLVFNKWWTQISANADEKGIFKTRAFYGDYIITSNGKTKKVTLKKKDKSVKIIFD
jgi:GH35 family endo-1,4-beta-xylanase